MKSRILGTTSMVAAALLFTGSAAQGADKIKLGLGGYFKAYLVAGSQDDGAGQPGANLRSHKIAREGEIFFKGKTTLDNGITFGVDVQLEAETCGDQIDESFIYVQGGFGKIVIGADDPASDSMYMGTPQPIAGIGVATPDDVFSALGNAVATPASITSISGDSEKITYFTPRMSGFQLGISYTPENCEEARAPCTGTYAGFQATNSAGQQSEIIEVGANYIRKIGDVDIGLYAGIGKGDLELTAAGAEDQDQWGLGVELGVAGFTIGADYREDDQGTSAANTDRTDYSLGVSYAMGNWTFGAAYAHGEVEAGAGLGEDETDGYQVGMVYDLSPGIVLTGGFTYWDVEDNLNAVGIENSASEFIVGTLLSF
ncbi:MAG: porin [Rhodospirillaceae bacterium]|nr:porin [Rhodospirillaceae bacterium]MBT7757783.1 porin [Rhodospirillaceae bacterium]